MPNGTLNCVTQLISFTCAVHGWMYLSRLKLNTYMLLFFCGFFKIIIFNTFDLATLWYNSLCQYPTSITSTWVNSNFQKQAHTRVLRFGPPSCKMARFFLSKCAKMAHIVFHPELSLHILVKRWSKYVHFNGTYGSLKFATQTQIFERCYRRHAAKYSKNTKGCQGRFCER